MARKPSRIKVIEVSSVKFNLMDVFNLYHHRIVSTPDGDAIMEYIDSLSDKIYVRLLRRTTKSIEKRWFYPNQIHIYLKGLSKINDDEISIVCNLATASKNSTYTITRPSGSSIICISDNGKVVRINCGEEFSISVEEKGKSVLISSFSFITHYLIKRGYDVFGFAHRGFSKESLA